VADVKLGLNLSYWGMGNDADNLALAREADELGFAVVWVAEAYGSDSPTVLAWIGAQTSRIDIGSAVMQIPGRSPAMTAMTAATLDTLSGGRFRLVGPASTSTSSMPRCRESGSATTATITSSRYPTARARRCS
jgi:alkanesulfonate monooxygenase SsuD/methylene tetrahydromethanopterin reductase-like flavin-dependent oxidoreductase (luciferase family)